MTEPLSKHIEDPVTEGRLQNIWQGIDARREEYEPSSSRRRLAMAIGGLAVAAGVAFGWFVGAPLHSEGSAPVVAQSVQPPHFEAGAALRTAGEKMSVDLEDGSKVTLSPRSRVAMQETHSDDVALTLQEGRVACQVAKDKGRTFSVLAGEVTVRVVGTKFSVERTSLTDGEKVSVDVQEGIVEVKAPDGVFKRLGAGESWSVKVDSEEVLAQNEAEEPAPPVIEEPAAPRVERAAPAKSERQDLFAEARGKRNAGDAAGAARLYQRFLTASPTDPRAGVAALELGRLRMDQLGDIQGAIGPLSRAASGVGGGLGDDALARLVRAHAQLGQTAACRSARARYLKTYPEGVHVERVRTSCP